MRTDSLGQMIAFVSATMVATAAWPQFRGSNCQGVADGENPPAIVDRETHLVWKSPLPPGVSSPCIWGNRIFVTACRSDTGQVELICLDREQGSVRWRRNPPTKGVEKVHEISSPAYSTPATDGERVYVHYAMHGLVAYDADGNTSWDHPLPPTQAGDYGGGASPIVSGGLVFLRIPRQGEDSLLLAIRAQDGAIAWKVEDSSVGGGRATPVVWKEGEGSALGVLMSGRFTAYDLASGTVLWSYFDAPLGANSTPAVGSEGLFLVGSTVFGSRENILPLPDFDELLRQYDRNQDGRLALGELPEKVLLVDRGGSGGAGNLGLGEPLRGEFGTNHIFDRQGWLESAAKFYASVTQESLTKAAVYSLRYGMKAGGTTNRLVWSHSKGVPEIPSPLLYRQRLYVVKNGGVLTCRHALTGNLIFEERLGAPGGYYASPVAGDGRLYLASDRGVVTVVAADGAFSVLSQVALDEGLMATPALAGGRLYVRTGQHLWAFGDRRN